MLEVTDQSAHVLHDFLESRTLLSKASLACRGFRGELDLPYGVWLRATCPAKNMTRMQSELNQDVAGMQSPLVHLIRHSRSRVVPVLMDDPLIEALRRGLNSGPIARNRTAAAE